MKGLLLKDFFTLSRQLRLFLVMLVIFALVPGMDLAAFAIVYAAILPLSAIAYDEQAKWDQLAVMLPYTPAQLVASKYLLGYLCCIAATLLSLLAQVAVPLISGAPLDPVALGGSLLSMVAAGIVQALMLPAVFRFGAAFRRYRRHRAGSDSGGSQSSFHPAVHALLPETCHAVTHRQKRTAVRKR